MKHVAVDSFWKSYDELPSRVRLTADKNFALLKKNLKHKSLYLKEVDRFWSVRIGIKY